MTRLLVDGNGVAVRAWWASAHDYKEMFMRAVERVVPTSGAEITVCWDSPNGSWRRDRYGAYKSGRPPKPKALIEALEECRRAFPGWVAHGYEADDLIATMAWQAGAEGKGPALILSDDKDLLQMADEFLMPPSRPIVPFLKCFVVNSAGEVFDADAVKKKLGVPPYRIRHLLSWMGDKADGLPGVPGYGPKRAIPKALAGEIGNALTYELTELVTVPGELMEKV